MIAIFGAFGKTGRQVATALVEAGIEPRRVTHDPAREGRDVVRADLSDEASLDRALAGAHAVYALLPDDLGEPCFHARRRAWVDGLARAIERARVPRVVAVSSSSAVLGEGPGHGFGSDLAYLERRLTEVTASLSVIRAPYFQDNVLQSAAFAERDGVYPCFFDSRERAIATVAARDVGHCAAQLLLEPACSGREIIDLIGPAYSPVDMAAALAVRVGRRLTIVDVPAAQRLAVLERQLSPEAARAMVETIAVLGSNELTLRGDRLLRARGTLARTLGGAQ